jgi:hypothetical protein
MLEPSVVHQEMETLVAMVVVLELQVAMQRLTIVVPVVVVVPAELEAVSMEARASLQP